MRGVIPVILFLSVGALAQPYLWATWTIPSESLAALPERAELLGIPIVRFNPEKADLVFVGATGEAELLNQNAFLYLDNDFFLIGIREGRWNTILRGSAKAAELVIFGEGAPEPLSSLAILEALGLLPPEGVVELTQKEIPTKLSAPPAGIRLDPVLWALVEHPDWFSFAQAQGLERLGLRVRVVAELCGTLSEEWEPFIRSSSGALAELLLPIPLLPELGKDPAVRIVRPPYAPVPLGG